MSFALYFLRRSLENDGLVLSEGAGTPEFRKAVKRVERDLKGSYVKSLYEKFPRIQYSDVEEAFDDAVAEVKKGSDKSEPALKRAIRRIMEKRLSGVNKKKRALGKSLSCVKAVKNSLAGGQSVSDLVKRAEKVLTSRELKILRMCSEGKPVRRIAEEMGTSFPTVWRDLNSALDKVRMSHGMRPRNLDRRGSN